MDASFQVVVNSFSHSPGEWKRVLEADDSGRVLGLNEEERLVASRLGLSEKEIAEKIKTVQFGELRLKVKGYTLGEHVSEVLQGLGPAYRLLKVLWEDPKSRWMLRIEFNGRVANVPVPERLADDVAETDSEQDWDRLKNLILFGVGRQELIFRR